MRKTHSGRRYGFFHGPAGAFFALSTFKKLAYVMHRQTSARHQFRRRFNISAQRSTRCALGTRGGNNVISRGAAEKQTGERAAPRECRARMFRLLCTLLFSYLLENARDGRIVLFYLFSLLAARRTNAHGRREKAASGVALIKRRFLSLAPV